jgi:hypothetical protein
MLILISLAKLFQLNVIPKLPRELSVITETEPSQRLITSGRVAYLVIGHGLKNVDDISGVASGFTHQSRAENERFLDR